MRHHSLLLLAAVAATSVVLPSFAFAAPSILAGSSTLLPNTPNQQIQFFVSGGDLVTGEDLNVQINAGTCGPLLTALDLFSGTLFASNNTGQNNSGIITSAPYANRIAIVSTTTASGTLAAAGLLATFTIDTTGINSGTFQINLLNTLNGNSDFILPSSATVVPSYLHNTFSIGSTLRQWNVNSGGTWDQDSNWTPFAPFAAGDQANFLGSVLSGTATVTLNGNRVAGSVTFNNAAATYNINAGSGGTLTLNNGASAPSIADLAGSHAINAPIAFASTTGVSVSGASDVLTLGGAISGSAGLSLSGSGSLVLSANNSYTTTAIAAGASLQVGIGGSTGTFGSGAVTNDGSLLINRSGSVSFANPISGTGALSLLGSQTLTLTGAANYSGNTSLNGNQITFAGGAAHSVASIQGPGKVQVAASTTLVSNAVVADSLQIGANAVHTLRNNGTHHTSKVSTFTPAGVSNAWTSTLDITNNTLIDQSTAGNRVAEIASLANQARQGWNSGLWNGTGITSSTNAADATHNSTIAIIDNSDFPGRTAYGGLPVDANSIIVTRAVYGDLNGDGNVDLADYDGWYAHVGTPTFATNKGDLNFDGSIDLADYDVWYKHVGATISPLSPGASPAPEPMTAALLGMGAAALLVRRRR